MKRLLSWTTVVLLLCFGGFAAEQVGDGEEITSIRVYEFSSDDPEWILNDPPLNLVLKEGELLFDAKDLTSFGPATNGDSEDVHFKVTFTPSAKERFDRFLFQPNRGRVFLVINETELITSMRACQGCQTLDGILPTPLHLRLVAFYTRILL